MEEERREGMSMKEQKSFIEVTFPIKEVSEDSAREKEHKAWTHFNSSHLVGKTPSCLIKGNNLCCPNPLPINRKGSKGKGKIHR
jgi:hypothetical protein